MVELLAEAAASSREVTRAVEAGAEPGTVAEPTLTVAAMALEPDTVMTAGDEGLGLTSRRKGGRIPSWCLVDPGEENLWDLVFPSHRRSLLWPATITAVELRTDGDRAAGVVTFRHPGCFSGRLPFTARRGLLGWRVGGFELPAAGVRVSAEGGGWVLHRPEPIPDLHRARLPDPISVIPSANGETLGVDGEEVAFGDLAGRAAGRPVTVRSAEHWPGPASRLAEILSELAGTPGPVLFVPRNLDRAVWPLASPPPEGFSDDDRRRGWVTRPEPVWRGQLGLEPLATIAVDRLGVSADGRRLTGFIEEDRLRHRVRAEPDAVFRLRIASDVGLAALDRALGLLAELGVHRLLLPADRHRGWLLVLKEPTWTPPPPPFGWARPKPLAHPPEREYQVTDYGPVAGPRRIDGPDPVYPAPALRARIQGVVVLEVTVTADGRVQRTKVLRGLPLGLTEAAVAAVEQWRFEPPDLHGEAVTATTTFPVRFTLR